MNKICLKNALPLIFSDQKDIKSDIWKESVSFEKGKYYLIEANSGTGKSSLCSYIYGYRNDYSGEILFDDDDIRKFSSSHWNKIRSENISYLFQELRLFGELTAFENVEIKNNLTTYKSNKEIDQLFDLLGIGDKKKSQLKKLSWGQQQRIAIIRALCQPFDFLLLDEPISHLDDTNALVIANLLSEEASSRGASIIATSIGKKLPLTYDKIFSL